MPLAPAFINSELRRVAADKDHDDSSSPYEVEKIFGTSSSEVESTVVNHFMKGSFFGLSGLLPPNPQNSADTLPATPVDASMSSIDSTPGEPDVASPTSFGSPSPHVRPFGSQ